MILEDNEASKRLNSPMNLINRLRNESNPRKSAMSLFIPPKNREEPSKPLPALIAAPFNPFIPPQSLPTPEETTKLSDILENSDSQIKLGLAHDKALNLLVNSVNQLTAKLDDVKADKLPAVISAAAKTVEGIRRERNEASKNNKDKEVHYHFYTPQQKTVADYKVIDVTT